MKKPQNSPRVRRRVIQRQGEHFGPNVSKASTPNSTKIRVRGQIVGTVSGDVFIKKVKASCHFLRIPPAIAFDVVSLRQAKKAGARIVKVIDTESGTTYRALLSNIWTNGFELDRGHGLQMALPLSEWSLMGGPLTEQLRLWEVS